VTCRGWAINVTSGAVTTIPEAPQGTFSITLAPGQTQAFPTTINLDLNNFDYDLRCIVSGALGSGAFTDPDPGNNTYIEEIYAVTQGSPSADLAVTDIFPDNLPQGEVYCRITNNGPDALQNATVELETDVVNFTDPSQLLVYSHTTSLTVTLQPGETREFDTGLNVDTTNNRRYSVSCEITSVLLDPNPGNNLYLELIESPNQSQPVQADLAVTDIFPQTLPQGDFYCRITNNGPDALQNATVWLLTIVIEHEKTPGGNATLAQYSATITVTLLPGETGEFSTGIGHLVDTSKYWYEITCEIGADSDPNPNNNIYTEIIESPTQVHLIQADLAVTDIFPDSLPQGDVYCRITNNGPDTLQNVSVQLVTYVTAFPLPSGNIIPETSHTTNVTVTLQPGETGEFDTDVNVDTDNYWYYVTSEITLPMLDPIPGNNIHTEQVGSPP
jgi:uncharacterized cupredoxin-like copper-binding protein